MKKYFILIMMVLLILFGTRYLIFARHMSQLNPMSYTYNYPINQVRISLVNIFGDGKFHGLDFVVGYDTTERELNHIDENNNRNHYFINWFGWESSGEYSAIYYNWWGRLKLIPSYHIILDSVSYKQTKITIESFPKVETGTEISSNHGFPYLTRYKAEVKPSTIEEYSIIKMIGDAIGEKNMPDIKIP